MSPQTDDDFEAWMAESWPRLVSFGYLICQDRGLAEDLAQEALARLHRRWDKVRHENPMAYARRSMVNQLTSWKRRPKIEAQQQLLGSERPSPESTQSLESRDEMWAALAQLPPRQRAAVVLRYYEDLDDAAIADILGCRPATVRSHISKGLGTLRGTFVATTGVHQ